MKGAFERPFFYGIKKVFLYLFNPPKNLIKLMKSIIALFILITLPLVSLSQNKKLLKMFKDGFVLMEASQNYPLCPSADNTFYPSKTLKGDTTGVSNKNEYIMFRDSMSFRNGELFKFFKKSYVTQGEYFEFMDWVTDSIFRELIYVNANPTGNNSISDELIGEMLDHPKVYYDEVNQYWTEFDPSQPYINRGLFPFDFDFDWRKRISYANYWPLIQFLYLTPYERFYDAYDLDPRKLNYLLQGVGRKGYKDYLGFESTAVNISYDTDIWAQQSNHPFDIYYNFSRYYDKGYFYYHEMAGLLGTQIKAYLNFLEVKYQKMIDDKKLPYLVKISLPTEEELKIHDCGCDSTWSFVFHDDVDLTEQWQITNKEYEEFLNWVEDSISRELIYRDDQRLLSLEDKGQMLNYEEIYYDEASLSWNEFDPADIFQNRNRNYFNYEFDWKSKLDASKISKLIEPLYENGSFIKTKYYYKYHWIDHQKRGDYSNLQWETEKRKTKDGFTEVEIMNCQDDNKPCRKLDLSNGVMRHENIGQYKVQEVVSLYPGINCRDHNIQCLWEVGPAHYDGSDDDSCDRCKDPNPAGLKAYDFQSNPEALIKDITYYQALAYYHWKYQRKPVDYKKEDPLLRDLVPSQEEFEKVQLKGEKMVKKNLAVDYPTPLFRYVIHVFKK